MPAVKLRLAQGTPCWVSLMTDDLAGARAFYGELLGWSYTPGPTQLGAYVRAESGGEPVAGLGVSAATGFPVQWTTYFAVDSADATAQLVRECGGTVAVGPLQAERAGRLAIAADVSGAVFGLWQGEEHPGREAGPEPGGPAWAELLTPDEEGAASFYGAVLGRPVAPADGGSALVVDDLPVAGIRSGAALRGHPPRWRVHFAVRDAVLTSRLAVELGGRVLVEPHATGRGRVARLADPQGGHFSVLETGA
ncbi:VOC family protein [Streptomyces sp. CB01881]|uniref:VOC family protein n=1 Tax=Streptomyces sp. CB01881 TaxID=2078691 RepID=UPI000CDCCC52|nr:VOC family protein [Streptomyces sp. CB01881]AUY49567.1 glyoxalase/bleomycin resistance/extradiol dioxygenase family protein [Streptomyces sp. CB01881]TYC72961.1 VOC family protein [Streptomyces sp. CB01881]